MAVITQPSLLIREVPPPPETMKPYLGKYGNGLIFDPISESQMACLPEGFSTDISYMLWEPPPEIMDQGLTFGCVGYTLSHYLQGSPNFLPLDEMIDPDHLYLEARKIDSTHGIADDGTELSAGIQVVANQGLVGDFRWAHCMETLTAWLLLKGPVAVGNFWSIDMIEVDSSGILKADKPPFEEGHCSLLIGYDDETKMYTGISSWGEEWADGGRYYIHQDDLTFLMTDVYGEAALISMTPPVDGELITDPHEWGALQFTEV